tara:strand:- start:442 stop:1047 length:606 start_codon:yes stop_codon:yes gene_type:complete
MDQFGISMMKAMFFFAYFVSNQVLADVDACESRIESFHSALIQVMKLEGDYNYRTEVLYPVVDSLFSLTNIARISLGRQWRNLEEKQQKEFVDLLRELIVSTYADRFKKYNGQSFVTISADQVNRGWVVKTELRRLNDKPVRLDYYFLGDGVFNVVADGVSDLSLRRADYNSILKTEGYLALLDHLRQKIDGYSNKQASTR